MTIIGLGVFLFADGEWIKFGTMAVFGTIWLVNFFASRIKERTQRQAMEQRMPNRPQTAGDASVNSEIEEFLKKAAKRDSAPGSAGREGAFSGSDSSASGRETNSNRRDSAIGKDFTGKDNSAANNANRGKQRKKADERESRRKRPPTVLTPSLAEKPMVAEVLEDNRRLSEHHVRSSLDDRQLQPTVTSDLSRSERSMDQHIRDKFAHPVGTLTATETTVENNSTRAAAAAIALGTKANIPLVTMLTGGNLKNAIVLNEILTRPEHRWERA